MLEPHGDAFKTRRNTGRGNGVMRSQGGCANSERECGQ
jgi:hypothetical protein